MPRKSLQSLILGCLTMVIVCAATTSEASILQPALAASIDDMLDPIEQREQSSSARTQTSEQDSPITQFALGQGTPASGSTTSSSSTGPNSGNCLSCALAATVAVGGDDPQSRLATDEHIFLPTPPSSEILRPPLVS